MPDWAIVLLIVAAIVVIALAVWAATRQRRTGRLQERFGPEYERTVAESGGRWEAERELVQRQERREQLDIRPLAPDAQRRYTEEWRLVQERFVDDPAGSVREADRLVGQVMRERGYPMDDFEQRAADVSVDHPGVVDDYRTAHDIATQSERDEAETEDLRRAMIHYRSLFTDLLETTRA